MARTLATPARNLIKRGDTPSGCKEPLLAHHEPSKVHRVPGTSLELLTITLDATRVQGYFLLCPPLGEVPARVEEDSS